MRVFIYIINTVSAGYRLTGCVPWFGHGLILFGPCKRRMRPKVRKGDYILGISGSKAGRRRRVLLWMCVAKRVSFAEAYKRGEADEAFRAARGCAIHVRPKAGKTFRKGLPGCYEHIPKAPHSKDWQNDIRGERDVLLVADDSSWVATTNGPEITEDLIKAIRKVKKWKNPPTVQNPLSRNARGQHVIIRGRAAQKIISAMSGLRLSPPASLTAKRTRECAHRCRCE